MIEVILAGTGERASAWHDVIVNADRLRLVGVCERPDGLGALLAAYPEARIAAALPPRAALAAAALLSERSRSGVVSAPLACDVVWPAMPSREVQVAHGWLTLPGRAWLQQALATRGPWARLRGSVRGSPESADGDLDEVLVHALAIVARLFPRAKLSDALARDESTLDLTFEAAQVSVELSVASRGHGLELELSGDEGELSWRWQPQLETRELRTSRGTRRSTHDTQPAQLRALRQLAAPVETDGDTLVQARAVCDLARAAIERVGGLAPGPKRFASALALERQHPDDVLGAIGLLGGALPTARGDVDELDVPLPPEPLEVWAFRAGLKPVVFLTLAPDELERAEHWLEGAHLIRRERRVATDAHDTWHDQRDLGEPRIELYAARDPKLAERAAELQTRSDPGASLVELGELMGYPDCCVQAFALQIDRNNNSRNRYATATRTTQAGPWPWQLANATAMLVPFFPCRYTCPRALDFAEASLRAAETEHPGVTSALRAALAHPVLYFAHDRALIFRPGQKPAVPRDAPPGFRNFARVFEPGDRVRLTAEALEIISDGAVRVRCSRTDPLLGVWLPFGDVR